MKADQVELLKEQLDQIQKEKSDLEIEINQLKQTVEGSQISFSQEMSKLQEVHCLEIESQSKTGFICCLYSLNSHICM